MGLTHIQPEKPEPACGFYGLRRRAEVRRGREGKNLSPSHASQKW
nr:MAG TPA: hypothetical protein [Caudoviricetes sp.]